MSIESMEKICFQEVSAKSSGQGLKVACGVKEHTGGLYLQISSVWIESMGHLHVAFPGFSPSGDKRGASMRSRGYRHLSTTFARLRLNLRGEKKCHFWFFLFFSAFYDIRRPREVLWGFCHPLIVLWELTIVLRIQELAQAYEAYDSCGPLASGRVTIWP